VVASSRHKDEARGFLKFLSAPQNAATIRETGLEPRAAATR
jgi:hypothetical protein